MKLPMRRLFKAMRIFVIALAIGVTLGYFSFYMTMPSVVVPATTNPSLVLASVILFGLGILVGLLSEDLESVTIEVMLGAVIGSILGWLLFVSPSFRPDIAIPEASGFIYIVLHSALPLLIVAVIVLFVGGFIGSAFMENLEIKAAPSQFADAESTSPGTGQHKS